MAKGLNQVDVSMRFTADTSVAKHQIQELQTSLTKLTQSTAMNHKSLGFSKEIQEALTLTTQLQSQLKSATNIDTGKLDLGRFNDSLKKSGTTLKQYQDALYSLGPKGAQAFSQLATSITNAEIPMKRINQGLQEIFTSLKNTARWQISSSVLHGFMSAVQSAYGYAEDLNESLNNIRIVTGQNIDQMAKFAEQANKAAKALNTTTTDYTDASLIYYQQGLTDAQVKERTDITIKMANVARESAEVVSDQMTAVWNNFDDGSKSLEYYADVMTALGAATASSTDEIAQGLEKFSAVADTVGLSYEYATAALATVTAETRQSADVVGTAFKTLFARIEGLSLGETLEDGTDLNKYSEALDKVGVKIKDASGEMRSMDDILNDLGARWQTLAKDEQIALAQTVAGVRQYNQLISLMDNWDVFQDNLSTAYGSSGALEEQAEIYAESWEAARNRVKASAEDVYDSLLDEKFFISLNDSLSETLDFVAKLIDSMGGMPGILSAISALVTKIFSAQLATSLENLVYNIKMLGSSGKKSIEVLREEANTLLIEGNVDQDTTSSKIAADAYSAQGASQQVLLKYSKNLTQEQMTQAQLLLDMQQQVANKLIQDGQELEIEQKKTQAIENRFQAQLKAQAANKDTSSLDHDVEKLSRMTEIYYKLSTYDIGSMGMDEASEEAKELLEYLNELAEQAGGSFTTEMFGTKGAEGLANIKQHLIDNTLTAEIFNNNLINIDRTAVNSFNKITKELEKLGFSEQQATEMAKKLKDQYEALGNKAADVAEGQKRLNNSTKNFDKFAKTAANNTASFSKALVGFGNGLSKTAMLINNIKGLINTLNNQDLTFGEKFTSALMSLGMILPNTISLISDAGKGIKALQGFYQGLMGPQIAYNALMEKENAQLYINKMANMMLNSVNKEKTANRLAEYAIQKGLITESEKELFVTTMLEKAKSAENAEDMKGIVTDALATQTIKARIAQKWAEIGVTTQETMATSKNSAAKLLNKAASGLAAAFGLTLTAAKTTETGAVIANTAAWYTNPIMWIALVIMGVIAAVALLAVGIVALTQALNAENKALQEAEEKEKRAAETMEVVNSRIQETTQSLKNLNDMADVFSELEKGSLEWAEAVNKVNQEIDKLIEEYPELLANGGIVFNEETGTREVTDSGKEYIENELIRQNMAAVSTNYLAQQDTAKLELSNLENANIGIGAISMGSDQYKGSGSGYLTKDQVDTYYNAYTKEGKEAFIGVKNNLTQGMVNNMVDNAVLDLTDASDQNDSYWELNNKKDPNESVESQRIRVASEFIEENYTNDTEGTGNFTKQVNTAFNDMVDNFSQRQAKEKEIEQAEQNYWVGKTSALGSNRNYDQIQEIVDQKGFDKGYSISDEGVLTYTKPGETSTTEWDMNDSSNYDKDNLPTEIKDFLKLKGLSADDYVAQRSGEMVVKGVDGKEQSFSKEEIAELIGEYYSSDNFKSNYIDALRGSLENKDVDLTGLEDEQIINLDNFKLGLDQTLGEKSDDTFNAMVKAYGTDGEAMSDFANDTAYIDTTSRAFENWSEKASQTKDNLSEVKNELKELNALGELEAKAGEFTEEMQSEGFSEEDATDAQEYAKHLMEIADKSEILSDELDTNAEGAQALAKQVTKMNRGVATLGENYEEWNDVLKNSSKESIEYSKAMSGMQSALSDILDVEKEYISDDFVTKHLEDIGKAAEGDEEAIDRLGQALSEQIVLDIAGVDDIKSLPDEMHDALYTMQQAIDNADFKVGATIDNQGFLSACQGMIDVASMTVDEAEAYFNSLGYDPEFVVTNVTETAPMYGKRVYTDDVIMGKADDGTPYVKEMTTREEQVYMGEQEQNFVKPALNPDGSPKIKTVTKKAGGSFNNSSSSNKGGGSGKGGGGGGGSKSKPAEKVKKTKKSDVVERYKEINDLLDDMADALDKASGKADRLYGKARIKAMKDQAKLMRDEIDLLKKKRAEADKYEKQDKKALLDKAKSYGLNFSIDKDTGNITNYTTQMEKLYNQLSAAEDKMDKMSTKEAQDEYKEKTVQPIQDKIDELKDLIDLYEETRELVEDLDKDIMEKEWAKEDLEFEAFEYEIELKIEVDDRDLQYLEYLLTKIEDKAFAAGERISLITQQTDEIISKSKTSQEAINTILGDNLTESDKALFDAGQLDKIDWQSYIDNETFTEAEVESLKEHADNLLAYNEELFAMQDQVHEELQNSFAEWNEEIEKGIALFDHYDSIVDHLQNITDLTQGLTGYNAELNRTLAETKTQLASDRAASYAVDYENQKAVADEMRSKIYDANGKETEWFTSLSEDEQAKWLEDLEVAEESVRQAEENLFASTSDAIQAAIDEFETAFTSSLKEMELALAGEGGFAAWNTELERQQDISERTLKTYQETYELSKLNRQVINSINDTDNIKAKQALLEIQEEIYQYQKDGKEMSQYELDYLQKKYELRLAEIALEEAQNAKSQVRMSRDSEGNWGYIYTADEDKVAEAEQNYEDKLYEITNLTQEYQDQVSASIIQTYQEFNDAMQEIYDRNAEGLYSSEEEFLNAIAETQAFYQGKLDFQYEQLDIATANSKALYEDDWTSYQFSTNAKIDSNKGFQNSFNATMAGVTTGYKDSADALSKFKDKVGTVDPKTGTGTGMLGGIAQAYNNMEIQVNKNLKNISKSLGMEKGLSLDLKNFAENAKKYLVGENKDDKNSVVAKSTETYEKIKANSEKIKNVLIGEDGKSGLLSSVEQFSNKWTTYIQSIIDKNEALVISINALNDALTKEDEKKKPKDEPKKNTPKNNNDDKKKQDEKLASRAASLVTSVHNGTIKNTGGGWKPNAKKAGYTDDEIALALKVINDSKAGSGYSYNYKKALELLGYDTGGYTGEWGKEGKLALLHQKELVLNAGETENFLLAMDILREITKAITLQSIIPDASKFNFGGKNIIEQDVTIHAEFPNVTDHNEIEMALSNLVNTASQYANRK